MAGAVGTELTDEFPLL
jgi:Mg2+-importing ATPase